MLLSGDIAPPRYIVQRRRARISARNRCTLATTGAGCLPASTRSKWLRAKLSSPLRKNARASSRRTRTRSGRSIRMVRREAMASSNSASRFVSGVSGFREAWIAARPVRNRTSLRPGSASARSRRTISASSNMPAFTSAWAPDTSTAPGIDEEGGSTAAFNIGAASRRMAPATRARRKGLIVIIYHSVSRVLKKRGWQNLPPSSRSLDL